MSLYRPMPSGNFVVAKSLETLYYTEMIYVKNVLKNFPVDNSVQGRYESSQTENGKNHFSAEFGAVSSCAKFLLPFQGEPF